MEPWTIRRVFVSHSFSSSLIDTGLNYVYQAANLDVSGLCDRGKANRMLGDLLFFAVDVAVIQETN